MPRVSNKESKNIYFSRREELKLTRDQASELLESIPPERIEKIENERVEPHPEEILIMAQKYKSPELCNYYCSNQCPIGQQYVPEVKIQDLSQIVLKMVDSLNTVQDNQRRLISITADGIVDDSEIDDFVSIQEELEKISITVEALQLWTEQMVANGAMKTVEPEEVVVEKIVEKPVDIELPGEVEKRVVTVEEVESKLMEMAELSTYSGEYTVTLGKDETRYLLDNIKVWGTTNSIEITASGIVKVGYDMNDIVVKVDDDRIYIKLPEAQLNDNYVIWDTVTCSESNNILNPIEFSQYQEIVDEIEEMGLADVESEGIYQNASENVKKIMNGFLSEFKDYEIVYM